jgi:AP-1 complex subunit beta-1
MDLGDLMGDMPSSGGAPQADLPLLLGAEQGKGLEIRGLCARASGQAVYRLTLGNKTQQPMSGFAIQINKNFFGIQHGGFPSVSVPAGGSTNVDVPLKLAGNVSPEPSMQLQVAIKCSAGVVYFKDTLRMQAFFTEDGQMGQSDFLGQWKSMGESHDAVTFPKGFDVSQVDALERTLSANNVFKVHRATKPGMEELYVCCAMEDGTQLLSLLLFAPGKGCKCNCRCAKPNVGKAFGSAIESILSN